MTSMIDYRTRERMTTSLWMMKDMGIEIMVGKFGKLMNVMGKRPPKRRRRESLM